MHLYNSHVEEFLKSVCRGIRYKGIHKNISRELSAHIEDQKNEYQKQGIDEETAVLKAIEQMGDPEVVGKQLNETHRPRTEWSVISLVIFLVLAGGFLQFSINESWGPFGSTVFLRTLIYIPVGSAVFIFMYFFDYSIFVRHAKAIYVLLLTLTAYGFIHSYFSYWLYLRIYYCILLFIPAFAGVVFGFKNKGYRGIFYAGLFYTPVAVMCIISQSFSSLFLFTISCLILLTVSIARGHFGANKKISLLVVYIPTILISASSIIYMALTSSHRLERIIQIINPGADALGLGFQFTAIKQALAASKFIGKAVPEGRTSGWMTDYSLTYIIAQIGYIAGFALIALLTVFIIRIFLSVLKQKNKYGFLVSLSAFIAITGQIILYVFANLGLIAPVTVVLPLISFGAQGFVVNMALMGLLLSVYRRTDLALAIKSDGVLY